MAETRLAIWDLFQLGHCLGMSLKLSIFSGWQALQNNSMRSMFLSCSLSAMSDHVFGIPLRFRFGFRFEQRVLNYGPCSSGSPGIEFLCGEEYGGYARNSFEVY
jgi:hypothetical protein